jgi:SAM-dependent methyltransferase
MMIKKMLRPLVPEWAKNAHTRYLSRKMDREFAGLPVEQIFEITYRKGIWGKHADLDFYSGSGSHAQAIVAPYAQAVRGFLQSLPERPDVVDLGCGDFNVGSQLRDVCKGYTACDVVGSVIEQNRRVYAGLDVDFRQLDIIDDPLPDGDVACIRQVLQHLSNEQIGKIVHKLAKYRYLVITEHVPQRSGFRPNAEKPAGPGTRIGVHSGVVLTQRPFSLAPLSQDLICSMNQVGGVVETIVYRLAD